MNCKYLIVDLNTKRFVQCWTENDTVFLTKNITEAQLYKTGEQAKSDAKHYQEDAIIKEWNENRFQLVEDGEVSMI